MHFSQANREWREAIEQFRREQQRAFAEHGYALPPDQRRLLAALSTEAARRLSVMLKAAEQRASELRRDNAPSHEHP
jgi:hypothetical protein